MPMELNTLQACVLAGATPAWSRHSTYWRERENNVQNDICSQSSPKKAMCQCGCSGYHTYQSLHEVFAWSMQLLRGKVAPSMKHNGRAFSRQELKKKVKARHQAPSRMPRTSPWRQRMVRSWISIPKSVFAPVLLFVRRHVG